MTDNLFDGYTGKMVYMNDVDGLKKLSETRFWQNPGRYFCGKKMTKK
jgi:hypothetical protein